MISKFYKSCIFQVFQILCRLSKLLCLLIFTGRAAGAAFRNSAVLANPFAGLVLGIITTAVLQSSSTSTSIVITMVSAGCEWQSFSIWVLVKVLSSYCKFNFVPVCILYVIRNLEVRFLSFFLPSVVTSQLKLVEDLCNCCDWSTWFRSTWKTTRAQLYFWIW